MKRKISANDAVATITHDATLNLISQILTHFRAEKKTINEMIFVPLSILSRIIRTHDAISLLVKNGHHTEAAILILSQFELRIDLFYVSIDIKNSTKWIEHENSRDVQLKIKNKIDMLFKKSDADQLYETFRYLSGIKHGNPVYSELAFPARGRGGEIAISTGDIDDKFGEKFSEAVFSYSVYQLACSAQIIARFIAQYAKVDIELLRQIHGLFLNFFPVEKQFLRFLKKKVSGRKTFFGIKRQTRK